MIKIILASKSAGRKKVLESLRIKFTVMPAEIDERKITASSPFLLVKKLARMKAEKTESRIKNYELRKKQKNFSFHNSYFMLHNSYLIIAADSIAIIEEKRVKDKKLAKKLSKYKLGKYYILGKPTTKSEAVTFLTTLSNNIHYFITGLCIINTKDKSIYQSITKTKLWFNKLNKKQIKDYVKIEPVLTYAGGYQIEKGSLGEKFVKKIRGSFTNVMGLPKEEVLKVI